MSVAYECIKSVFFLLVFAASLPFQALIWLFSLVIGLFDLWRLRHP